MYVCECMSFGCVCVRSKGEDEQEKKRSSKSHIGLNYSNVQICKSVRSVLLLPGDSIQPICSYSVYLPAFLHEAFEMLR